MLYCNQKAYHSKLEHHQNKYLNLRKKYPFFEYQSYSFQLKNQTFFAEFCFNISGIYHFKPTIEIPGRAFYNWKNLDDTDLNNIVFHIGMIELISYWKATCSPGLIIKPHVLDNEQVNWWKKLYYHGLGEFFYLNGIENTEKNFIEIESQGDELTAISLKLDDEKIIVPIGGGKDSVVTLELLKRSDKTITPMALNPRLAIDRTIDSAGFKPDESIIVQRKLDPLLIELNEKGFLNGHTPFSAMLAFVNLLAAFGSGIKFIALSNESSANQSTIPGTRINHQYSKSIEFERDFRWYVKKYIHPDVDYFSFLRPLNELQIANLFSRFPWHFKGFRSCNVGSKNDKWCGKCPKCLFTDIMLAPFISREERLNIFGKSLLDDIDLEYIFKELTGESFIKPFECVGMPEEVRAALFAFSNQIDIKDFPILLSHFLKEFNTENWFNEFKFLISQFDDENFIPAILHNILKDTISNSTGGFKMFLKHEFYHIKNILLLGFGKEGRSSYQLIRNYFPDLEIGIADKNKELEKDIDSLSDENLQLYVGVNYLDAIDNYDLIIKSPGIRLEKSSFAGSKITSQTELFLKYFRDQVIGVTGTKGKSTTVSLIHHFLKHAGKKSVLLGNIGVPAFDLVEEIDHETIIVFELSAHQLEGIKVSPHIAVLLNIYPEHLDHFESFADYELAKLNIGSFQNSNDKIIGSEQIVNEINGFKSDIFMIQAKSKAYSGISLELKGSHNLLNIEAAIMTAELFGVNRREALESLVAFQQLPHRLEYVGEFGGIKFYNDSISTIPESTIAAVQTIEQVDTLILGGFDRGLNYKQLVDFLKNTEIGNFIFLGQAGERILKCFDNNPNSSQKLYKVSNLEEAFKILRKETKKGKICLLSPAASSYDMFHNFEHRGDLFKSLASRL